MAESTKTYSDKLQNQHSPVYPEGYQTRRARQPANIPFEKSFSQQFFYLPGSTPLILRPQFVQPEIAERDSRISAALVDLKQNQTAYLIPAWNEYGYPYSFVENEKFVTRFAQEIHDWAEREKQSVAVKEIWAVANDVSWAEKWFLITGINGERARKFAGWRNHKFVFEWSDTGLDLSSINPKVVSSQEFNYSVELAPVKDCLLQINPTGEPCNPYGGPYGGKAMAARGVWECHHNVIKRIQPDSICANGNPINNNVGLSSIWLGSRYGGYAWG